MKHINSFIIQTFHRKPYYASMLSVPLSVCPSVRAKKVQIWMKYSPSHV